MKLGIFQCYYGYWYGAENKFKELCVVSMERNSWICHV